ncbi:WhiB family transcriptional regulator [Streptomyces sp. NPDC056492]|uniref:WhiB family transcriptional regulator n=1 Tax=unclassified Streptomyces TaxID=2593676 RepID=UPI0036CBCD26
MEDDAVRDSVAPSSDWITDWSAHAACRTTDPDELYVQGAAQSRAKAVCTGCPVRTECLADALDNRVEFGVWGGMTERERRALLRRRPTVTSWRSLLQSARAEYERKIRSERQPPTAAPAGEGSTEVVDKAMEWTA